MTDTVYALSLLTPFDIDVPKIRIGPNSDGGYVLANRLFEDQAVVSYGISTEYRFDQQMAQRGHHVYMFDHTIEPLNVAEPMRFFNEGVSHVSAPDQRLYTIEEHLERHKVKGNRLILKMDIEGHEYETILHTKLDALLRFEQMTIEFHNIDQIWDEKFRKKFVKTLEKINAHFTLFHVHANNHGGSDKFRYIDGLTVCHLLELSYIRTNCVNRKPSQTLYPTYLDYPNVEGPDKRLWFYPFLPCMRSHEEFAASWRMTALNTQKR